MSHHGDNKWQFDFSRFHQFFLEILQMGKIRENEFEKLAVTFRSLFVCHSLTYTLFHHCFIKIVYIVADGDFWLNVVEQ